MSVTCEMVGGPLCGTLRAIPGDEPPPLVEYATHHPAPPWEPFVRLGTLTYRLRRWDGVKAVYDFAGKRLAPEAAP